MSDFKREINLWNYDAETDILFFRDNRIKYHSSILLGDLIVELDETETPMGMELLNASVNFRISKTVLRNIKKISAEVDISKEEIKVKMKIFVISRNARIEKVSTAFGINDINLQPVQTAMVY
ncbi:DUF2283 domain-containing protein [Methanosarcina sp. MSH10X1]|uniref:DUF2283 domain-containing protein n=1 Tax=Methanosarcina sp. MSH10X1 TaxID=2507075 RepID=UPI0013E3784A|nr:DUF2283 domain-containing protein [Methanosarcina sp. MSH10X1]